MDDKEYKYLNNRLNTIELIVLGSPELNIPSVNDRLKGIDSGIDKVNTEVAGINHSISEMQKGKERERWTQYAITFFLALTSIGMMTVIIMLLQIMR